MIIDILMPYYGDPDHFKEAVQSVLGQDDPNWRLVVLNDCYPLWDPQPWVTGLNDPRVHYAVNDENLGVYGSFERCIDLAENMYAVILGCDDRMRPTYIATARALISQFNEPEYLQPGVTVIDESGAPALPLADRVKRWVQPSRRTEVSILIGESAVTSLMTGNWTYFPALCWRVDQLRKHRFTAGYEIVLDLALQLDILTNGGRLIVAAPIAFEYRRHRESASSFTASDGTRFIEERDFYRSAAARLAQLGWKKAARAARCRLTSRLNAFSKLPAALSRGDFRAARLLFNIVLSR